MALCYTHRFMPLINHYQSSLFFPTADMNKYRDLETDNMQRVKDRGILRPKRNVSHQIPLLRAELFGRGERSPKSQSGWSQSLLDSTGLHTYDSKRLWQHAQSLPGPAPDGVLELEVDTCLHRDLISNR